MRREGDVDAAVDGLVAVVDAAQHGQNLAAARLHGHQSGVGQVLGRVDLADVLAGQLLGQALGRVLLAVHNDRLYRLTFVPADPTQSDVYAQMETLFAQVLATFRFLP